jgi:4,5-DOPA dioxygenase extradiol
MYPNADIPVLQLSIDYHKPAQFHYNLGKQLAFLRTKGVLIIGSGNMVHNLGMVGAPKGKALGPNTINEAFGYDWALEINETFKKLISSGNHQSLIDYHKLGKPAELAIPTPDHYYPLLYSLGLVTPTDKLRFFNDKCLAGSLSMTSVLIES